MQAVLYNWLTYCDYTFAEARERVDYLVAAGALSPADAQSMLEIARQRGKTDSASDRVAVLERAVLELAAMLGGKDDD